MDTKATNPKDAVGVTKTPFSTLSMRVMAEVGVAMLEGALKYGRHNYRVAGVRASVYYDAAFRHLGAWYEGQDIDPESGLSHITKAIAGLMVLRDSMLQGNWVDDRPPKTSNLLWVDELNEMVKKLLVKYPAPKAAFTALGLLKKIVDKVYDNFEAGPSAEKAKANVKVNHSFVPAGESGTYCMHCGMGPFFH